MKGYMQHTMHTLHFFFILYITQIWKHKARTAPISHIERFRASSATVHPRTRSTGLYGARIRV